MLAIATNNIDSIAETYVRQHIRLIAPGSTSVLYFGGKGDSIQDVPSFRIKMQSSNPFILRKIKSLWRTLYDGYAGSVIGKEAQQVSHFLQRHGTKTILAEFGPTGCALRQLCKQEGLRLFVNFHGYDATVMPQRYLIRRAYKKLARDADGFVCGSHFFSNKLEKLGFPRNKINVIPCGIEIEKFQNDPKNKDSNLVVAVGRLTPKKVPHLSIEAFAKAKRSWPDARFEIIGDGPLYNVCEQKIAELGLSDCVTLHGAKDHEFVKQTLARAGIFVQHSVTAPNGDMESQGISLLEAMASGLPVVATRHNGFPETVVENVTGYLVNENDVNSMADMIEKLLKNRSLQRQMGCKGRFHVQNLFNEDLILIKLRNLIFN